MSHIVDRDVVFPDGNEAEFVKMAKALGWKKLLFVYDKPHKPIVDDSLDIRVGVLGKRKQGQVCLLQGMDRSVIERGGCDIVYDCECEKKPDFLHHRRSGLNQVLCAIMKRKGVTLAFSLRTLLCGTTKERTKQYGRMLQNARLARKYGVTVLAGSFAQTPHEMRNPRAIEAFLRELGF